MTAPTSRTLLAIMLAILLVPGVGAEDKRRKPEGTGQDGAPALHAVQNDRLLELMNRMNALLFERMPTELEIDQERRRQAAEIAQVADAMAGTVDEIVASLPQLALAEDENTVFMVLAGRLREHVTTLQAQAHGNHIDGIPATVERMGATCDGCHQLFRDPAPRATPPATQQ